MQRYRKLYEGLCLLGVQVTHGHVRRLRIEAKQALVATSVETIEVFFAG